MSDPSASTRPFKLSTGGLAKRVHRWIGGPESRDFPVYAQILIAIALLWLPLVLLSLIEGTFSGTKVPLPLMSDIVPNVRFLIAIPLLLLADLDIDPATGSAIHQLQESKVVRSEEKTRFDMVLTSMRNALDSIWSDVVIVLLAISFTWLIKPGYNSATLGVVPTSWMWSLQGSNVQYSVAGWWYLLISGPMFQVILFRWLWRFFIWTVFLFRVSRLPLTLRPSHPDRAGGLGYLGVAQQSFIGVFLAFAAVASSTIGHDIISDASTFRDERLEIVALVTVFVLVIYAPVSFFSKKLFVARRVALKEYGSLGEKLSEAFHEKWIGGGKKTVGPEMLASADASAMADYSATYDNVRSMRVVPVTLRQIVSTAGILLVPFAPLALTEYSLRDLLTRLTEALV